MIPSSVVGVILNLDDTSDSDFKWASSELDNKAQKTFQALTDGRFQRFEYFRKLQELRSVHKKYTDETFDTLNINFNLSRPVDTNGLMSDLKTQYEMGAISKRAIIEQSPYTTDVELELERINAEMNRTAGEPKADVEGVQDE